MSIWTFLRCKFGSDVACAEFTQEVFQEYVDGIAAPLEETVALDITGPLRSPQMELRFNSGLFFKNPTPILPDGRIASIEETNLFHAALRQYLKTTPDNQDQEVYNLTRDLKTKCLLDAVDIPLSVLKPVAEETCAQVACNVMDRIPIDYLAREIRMAEAKHATTLRYYRIPMQDLHGLPDQGSNPDFIHFAASRTHLPKGVIQSIHTAVVGWVPAAPDDPVLFIWLDQHNLHSHQRAMLVDWVNLKPYDPLYGYEGLGKGTEPKTNELQQDISTTLKALNKDRDSRLSPTDLAQALQLSGSSECSGEIGEVFGDTLKDPLKNSM